MIDRSPGSRCPQGSCLTSARCFAATAYALLMHFCDGLPRLHYSAAEPGEDDGV